MQHIWYLMWNGAADHADTVDFRNAVKTKCANLLGNVDADESGVLQQFKKKQAAFEIDKKSSIQ